MSSDASIPEVDASEEFMLGKDLLRQEKLDRALRAFARAYKVDGERPEHMSYYGLCAALRGGRIGLGLELCMRAIKQGVHKADFYANLGRVYLVAGNKKCALKVFLKGLRFEPRNEEINARLIELGFRKRPVIPMLGRSNPVNKALGILIRRTLPRLIRRS